jgi:hypothetical protein
MDCLAVFRIMSCFYVNHLRSPKRDSAEDRIWNFRYREGCTERVEAGGAASDWARRIAGYYVLFRALPRHPTDTHYRVDLQPTIRNHFPAL